MKCKEGPDGRLMMSFCFVFTRFRSIAKSYFRKADGVLLLYDVTCEKSFLDVREWVDMVEVRIIREK